MLRIRSASRTVSRAAGCALAAAALGAWGLTGGSGAARAATTMCQPYQVAHVDGGAYTVQDDEWDSSAAECVSADGPAGFTVTSSAIANATNGAPGGYPSIYAGCQWGDCTQGALAAHPVRLGDFLPGSVTTSLATTDPAGGAYDVAYDIWINQAPATSGAPDGTEIMIWLNHHGAVQPSGSKVASGVWLDGYQYDIWYHPASGGVDTITYEMTTAHTEVTNLDIGALTADAEQRGYTNPSWYLITVEAGFEIWQGGTGLAANNFSVALGPER